VLACDEHGVKVIAVGIETEDEARECASLGCLAGQGAWFGGPQTLASLLEQKLEPVQAGSRN